jgi:hypothetical protein
MGLEWMPRSRLEASAGISDRSKYLAGIEMSIEVSMLCNFSRNIFICQDDIVAIYWPP